MRGRAEAWNYGTVGPWDYETMGLGDYGTAGLLDHGTEDGSLGTGISDWRFQISKEGEAAAAMGSGEGE